MTSIHQNLGCSPIKPSFKGNTDVLNAAADWIEQADKRGYDEDSFHSLEAVVTEKMSDGPLKTFAKIATIAAAAGVAGKTGIQKAITKASNNEAIRVNIMQPMTKFVDKNLQKLTEFINESPAVGQKSVKGFIMTNAKKGMEALDEYAKKGTEELNKTLNNELNVIKTSIRDKVKQEAAKKGKKLTNNQIAAEVKKRLAGKSKQAENYRKLVEQRDFAAATNFNLIKQAAANTAGIFTGTTAAVAANRDKDGDGIADIGQHSAK